MSFVKIKSWLASLSMLALVACGGGGGGAGGDPILGGGGSSGVSVAAKIDVRSSNATLGDGDSSVNITAVVKDSNDAVVKGASVKWSFDAGYLLESTDLTDASGTVTAKFAALDRTAGTATIKVTAGAVQGTISIALRSSRQVSVDSAAKLLGVAINGETATITATVKDLNNVAIGGASISWGTDVGTLKNITSVTSSDGTATATFDAGATLVKSLATITVSSGATQGAVQIPITAVSKTIELLADSTTIGTGGDQVVIRAFVKNGLTNASLAGQSVTWSTSSGTLSGITAVTDSVGIARATLAAGSDKKNRDAIVTATSGPATQTLKMPIVDTKINYSGPTTTSLDSSSPVSLAFTVVDSKGVGIPDVLLEVGSALGNPIPALSPPTNSAGQATMTFLPTKAGLDTVTVRGAGAVKTIDLTINGSDEKLAFVPGSLTSSIPVGQTQSLKIQYLKAGVAQANKVINLAATVGVLSAPSVTTDANGEAFVSVQSSFAGTSTITGALAGGSLRATTQVSFIATLPHKLLLQVSRSALPPNTDGSALQLATVFAKVIDSNFNPVPGVTVNFSQQADPSQGILQQASADTDASGVATVLYQSGPNSTASSAVVLKGTVASSLGVSGTTTLTVNERSLFLVLGTGNSISNFDEQTYQKNWTVYVTDANGVRVPNKLVTVKVIPTVFKKGWLTWNETASQWIDAVPPRSCPNEDGPDNPGYDPAAIPVTPVWTVGGFVKPGLYNFNGFLDPGEDLNQDGLLTPGNVVLLNASTVTTDSNGFATVTMKYAEIYAPWLEVRLTATVTVEGTETTSFREFPLDRLAGDFSVKTVSPAGAISPFGQFTATCNNKN